MIFACEISDWFLSDDGDIRGVCIARPINGITLNGLEWLYMDDNVNIRLFPDKEKAIEFLMEHGCTEQDIRGFRFFYHTGCEYCGMWLLVEDVDITKDEMGMHAYHETCGYEFDIN